MLALAPVAAFAQVRVGTEFQVNTHTASGQFSPRVASDADGNFVVVWQSEGQDGSGLGVFGRRFDAAGRPLGPEFRVNTHMTGNQVASDVTADGNGNFVVVWLNLHPSTGDHNILARRYDSSGTPSDDGFQVNTVTRPRFISRASVAMSASGNFVVAWKGEETSDYERILIRRFAASGAPLDPVEVQVNAYVTGHVGEPAVASDAAGNFVVTWPSAIGYTLAPTLGGGPPSDVHARRFDASGNAHGPEFRVNTYTAWQQSGPSVAVSASGEFVVAWQSNYQDGSEWGVFAQRYDASGSAVGGELRLNEHTTANQRTPVVAIQDDGGFIAVWHSHDGSDIFARSYDAAGVPLQTSESRVNSYTTASQASPHIDFASGGSFVVTWHSDTQDGSSTGIFGQRLALDLIFVDGFESGALSGASGAPTDRGDLPVPSRMNGTASLSAPARSGASGRPPGRGR